MSKSQKQVFLESEGDSWLSRNREKLRQNKDHDPVLRLIRDNKLQGDCVLEIGCANGWRLQELQTIWPDAQFHGLDPSSEAAAWSSSSVHIRKGTADALPYQDAYFDFVIFGFCLYLCDRGDLFRIAAEADRVLKENGILIVYDFYSPEPYRNPYTHQPGVFSYKMDYSRLFSWNPAYKKIAQIIEPHYGMADHSDNYIGAFAFRKNPAGGWTDAR